jgi:hypothetical protein
MDGKGLFSVANVELIRAYGVGSVDWLALFDESLILGMWSNPKPNEVIAAFRGQRPHPRVHSSRPKLTDLLKMQRWVRRSGLQKRELAIGLLTCLGR